MRLPKCERFEDLKFGRFLRGFEFAANAAENEASIFANKLISKTRRIEFCHNVNVGIAMRIQNTASPMWTYLVFISYIGSKDISHLPFSKNTSMLVYDLIILSNQDSRNRSNP